MQLVAVDGSIFFKHGKYYLTVQITFQLIKDILDVVKSEDSPKLPAEVLSQSAVLHELHCERAWLNIVPVLKMWLRELAGLEGS